MDGYQLVALLMGIGVILFIAELMLPTHGVLGILGGGAMIWGLVVCTKQIEWAGLSLLVAVAAATPLVWIWILKIWPRTPMGRRIMLPNVPPPIDELVVRVGQIGTAVSELRPMGTCEFDGTRIESMSEHGIVPAGTSVKVVALANQRPVVRIA
jgi:membrane-bound serine protease (ClpP class)